MGSEASRHGKHGEAHVAHASRTFAAGLAKLAMNEALRIEQAFSRYRVDLVYAMRLLSA